MAGYSRHVSAHPESYAERNDLNVSYVVVWSNGERWLVDGSGLHAAYLLAKEECRILKLNPGRIVRCYPQVN